MKLHCSKIEEYLFYGTFCEGTFKLPTTANEKIGIGF